MATSHLIARLRTDQPADVDAQQERAHVQHRPRRANQRVAQPGCDLRDLFRPAGVAGMRDVLRPGGRAVIATWRSLEQQRLLAALAEIEHRHLEAADVPATWEDTVRPFSLGDETELGDLFRGAGFTDVVVDEATVTTRFAEPDRFVERMAYAYAAVIPAFVEDAAAFHAFVAGVSSDAYGLVAQHRQGDHVVGTMTTLVLTARR